MRKKESINFNYKLNSEQIKRVENFLDLGVLFDKKLTFSSHIDSISSKAMARLGMIKRWSKEFNYLNVTKCLYVSLVRSVLEFASVVWNPFYETNNNKIESIQKQFLLFSLKNLNWSHRFQLPPYRHRLLLLQLNTLDDRRRMLNVIFIEKLLTGRINCPL